MECLLGDQLFQSMGKTYDWIDACLMAKITGYWDELEKDVQFGHAALQHSLVLGQVPDDVAIEEALSQFFLEHSLVSASNSAQLSAQNLWLSRRRLTKEDLRQYISKFLLREQFRSQHMALCDQYPISDKELQSNLLAEGFCSGYFQAYARLLASRVCLAREAQSLGTVPPVRYHGISIQDYSVLLSFFDYCGFPTPSLAHLEERLSYLATIEHYYSFYLQRLSSHDILGDVVSCYERDLTWIDALVAVFSEEEQAQAFSQQARSNGASLIKTTQTSNVSLFRLCRYLEDFDTDLKDSIAPYLAQGKQCSLLGPFPMQSHHVIIELIQKVSPSLDHAITKERALTRALELAVQANIAQAVVWQTAFQEIPF